MRQKKSWIAIIVVLFLVGLFMKMGFFAEREGASWKWQKFNPGTPHTVDLPDPSSELFDASLLPAGVECLLEGGDGTLYIGTQIGLSLLRGNTLLTYSGNIKRDKLLDGWFTSAVRTPDGAVLLSAGKEVLRHHNERWSRISWGRGGPPLSGFVGNELPEIMQLFCAQDGTIYLGTRKAGVFSLDPKTRTAKLIHYDNNDNHWVTAMAEDRQGQIWIAVSGVGVICYASNEITVFTDEEDWIPDVGIRSLCVDELDRVWVGAQDGLGMLDTEGRSTIYTQEDVLPDNTIWELTVRDDGGIWAHSESGYAVYDGSTWSYPSFNGEVLYRVDAWTVGESGNVWIGDWKRVYRNPAMLHSHLKPRVHAVQKRKSEVEAQYPNIEIDPFTARDAQNRIWVHVAEKILRYDGEGWEDFSGLHKDFGINFLTSDRKGRVWIGTTGAGLLGYNEQGEAVYSGEMINNGEVDDSESVFFALAEHPNGNLYIGSDDGLLELAGKQWRNLTALHEPSVFVLPWLVVLDKQGWVWFTDFLQGICYYDHEKMVVVHVVDEWSAEEITALEPQEDGTMLFEISRRTEAGPEKKRYLYDPAEGKTREIPSEPPK